MVLTQALAKHIEQMVALPDDLRQETIARYKQLCDTCGCHNEHELSEALQRSANLVGARSRGSCEFAVSSESGLVCRPASPWERQSERLAGIPYSCICADGPQPPTQTKSSAPMSSELQPRGRPSDAASGAEEYDSPGSWCWTHGPNPQSGCFRTR